MRYFAVSRAGVGVHNRRILLVELNKWSPTLRMTLECRHTACIHVSQAGLWIHPWETRPHDLQVVSRHLTTCCLQTKSSYSKSKWRFLLRQLAYSAFSGRVRQAWVVSHHLTFQFLSISSTTALGSIIALWALRRHKAQETFGKSREKGAPNTDTSC